MPFVFRAVEFEMDHEAYIDFLLRHHDELNLPYPFAMKLSFISSPLFLGQAMLAINEESYELVGAAGFGYGTGPGNYEDKHICQIEVAFIEREWRRSPLFAHGLRALVEAIRAGNPEVSQVQFWIAAADAAGRLFAKFLALPGASQTFVNQLALVTVPFHELERYCLRLRC
ncbi:hypothetical protein [Paenibacillus cymbidii]|uniref:hypothetical protein n=1 Tax=Paenibacillus cymbidii TaxID=1639034 RepID=UPI001081D880|nr:hypothetical protein [Paenibacillus cymbidii]